MRRYVSPLRYPGGKSTMASTLGQLFAAQYGLLEVEVWIEPFAGGLGAGLTMLDADAVGEVWFTETNPCLAAFWRHLIANTDALADQVADLHPTLDLFDHAKQVAANPTGDDAVDGLAAFVLNRCSRSGIIDHRAGPIGGRRQDGKHRLCDRFDPDRLATRIAALKPVTARMKMHAGDGIDRIAELDGSVGLEDEVLAFVDPPYVRAGDRLYAGAFTVNDHRRLAAALNNCAARWVLTYDDHPWVRDWYPGTLAWRYKTTSTAATRRNVTELLLLSDNVNSFDPVDLLGESATYCGPETPSHTRRNLEDAVP